MEITDSFIDQCYAANELGDGTLFAALHQGRYLYASNSGEWYCWAEHCWQRDIHDSAATACEAVAAQYLLRADSLAAELKELAAGGNQDAAACGSKLSIEQQAVLRVLHSADVDIRTAAILTSCHETTARTWYGRMSQEGQVSA